MGNCHVQGETAAKRPTMSVMDRLDGLARRVARSRMLSPEETTASSGLGMSRVSADIPRGVEGPSHATGHEESRVAHARSPEVIREGWYGHGEYGSHRTGERIPLPLGSPKTHLGLQTMWKTG